MVYYENSVHFHSPYSAWAHCLSSSSLGSLPVLVQLWHIVFFVLGTLRVFFQLWHTVYLCSALAHCPLQLWHSSWIVQLSHTTCLRLPDTALAECLSLFSFGALPVFVQLWHTALHASWLVQLWTLPELFSFGTLPVLVNPCHTAILVQQGALSILVQLVGRLLWYQCPSPLLVSSPSNMPSLLLNSLGCDSLGQMLLPPSSWRKY